MGPFERIVIEAGPWPFIAVVAVLLLAGVFRSVLTGRLVPRSTYADKAAEVDTKTATIREQERQIAALLEVGKTVEQIMHALSAASRQDSGRGP